VLKLVGVAVLGYLDVQALHGTRNATRPPGSDRRLFGEAFLTSATNPKLAVFFVAPFPGFIPDGASVMPCALAMAALVIAAHILCDRVCRRPKGPARERTVGRLVR
jgi:threonine/homoserine/homoserine lactone efflux protein